MGRIVSHESFAKLIGTLVIPNLHRHAVAGGVHVRRDEPLGRAEEVRQLALVGDGLVDRVLGVHRLVVRLLLLPLKCARVHLYTKRDSSASFDLTSVTRTMILPARLRPVLPIRWTRRMGDLETS